eukprot:4118717-Pleurochrysis_carterae.AAC.1
MPRSHPVISSFSFIGGGARSRGGGSVLHGVVVCGSGVGSGGLQGRLGLAYISRACCVLTLPRSLSLACIPALAFALAYLASAVVLARELALSLSSYTLALALALIRTSSRAGGGVLALSHGHPRVTPSLQRPPRRRHLQARAGGRATHWSSARALPARLAPVSSPTARSAPPGSPAAATRASRSSGRLGSGTYPLVPLVLCQTCPTPQLQTSGTGRRITSSRTNTRALWAQSRRALPTT